MRYTTLTLLCFLTFTNRPGFAQTAAIPTATTVYPAPPPGYVYVPAPAVQSTSIAPVATPTPSAPTVQTTPPPTLVPQPQSTGQTPAGLPPPPPGYVYVPVPVAPATQVVPQPPPVTQPWNTPTALPANVPPRSATTLNKRKEEPRKFIFGMAPMVLANVHWLDQPDHRRVTTEGVHGKDRTYPGFVGGDLALGFMFDFRAWDILGAEIDLLYQNDHGRGTIIKKDRGSICYLPNDSFGSSSTEHEMTIGQRAWHIPVLLKLSIPGEKWEIEENDRILVVRKSFSTFAFGPEFVIPQTATLKSVPTGISHPTRATASTYVMYTGSLGWERRLAKSVDLRLILSLRGSYNPGPKNSAQRRGEYHVIDNTVQPFSYKSEWRFQAAASLGVGWFF